MSDLRTTVIPDRYLCGYTNRSRKSDYVQPSFLTAIFEYNNRSGMSDLRTAVILDRLSI